MTLGRPIPVVVVSTVEREQLTTMAGSRSLPHALVRRAKIILMAAAGLNNTTIASKLALCGATVGQWRKRFLEHRIAGLYDELKPGAPRSISDEEIARLIRKTLKTKPRNGTHWSCRSLAKEVAVSKSTVQRVWQAFGPPRVIRHSWRNRRHCAPDRHDGIDGDRDDDHLAIPR